MGNAVTAVSNSSSNEPVELRGGTVVRAAGETSYRADVAFCVMTLLAALVIACDTDFGGSSPAATSVLTERDVQASVQVDHRPTAGAPTAAVQPEAITRR
jgi:hypothetical protein